MEQLETDTEWILSGYRVGTEWRQSGDRVGTEWGQSGYRPEADRCWNAAAVFLLLVISRAERVHEWINVRSRILYSTEGSGHV